VTPVDNTEPLSIYAAGPGQAPCLARMILAAARGRRLSGFLDVLLRVPERTILDILARLSVHPAQVWGRLDRTQVALVDGVCAGTITFGPEPEPSPYPFTPQALKDAAARAGLTPAQVLAGLTRQQAYMAQWPELFAGRAEPGTWLIEYLGVRRENRLGGVAQGLMTRARDMAGAAGASRLELYQDQDNALAGRLFASLGYKLVGTYAPAPGMEAYGPAVNRLRLNLSGF
jgi:GNAT superfamily N-acetyltransferase